MQGFQLITNFLVLPIFFLSGALYPLNNLPRPLAAATRLDPLPYRVGGIRGALIGLSQIGPLIDFAVLLVVAGVFLALGARAFARIQA